MDGILGQENNSIVSCSLKIIGTENFDIAILVNDWTYVSLDLEVSQL